MACWESQTWLLSEPFHRHTGSVLGLAGLLGAMVSLGEEAMMLRRMLNPAPVLVLKSRSSTRRWLAEDRPLAPCMMSARPNASENPKPSMCWNVVDPLTVTAEAAAAGDCPIRTDAATVT